MNSDASGTMAAWELREAERLFEAGLFRPAMEAYLRIVESRILTRDAGAGEMAGHEVIALERLGDLAVHFGEGEAARDLFLALAVTFSDQGNGYGRDYMAVKACHVLIQDGKTREAQGLLESLRGISPLESLEITEGGLRAWESRAHWPGKGDRQRAFLLTRVHLAMGGILASLGQYGEAMTALRRGLSLPDPAWGMDGMPEVPLRLALSSAALEQGDFASMEAELKNLASLPSWLQHPDWEIKATMLRAKLHALLGEFGAALAATRAVAETYGKSGNPIQALHWKLNLAFLGLSLNQTRPARQLLASFPQGEDGLAEPGLQGRLGALRRLLALRSGGSYDMGSLGPSVTEMWEETGSDTAAGSLDMPPQAPSEEPGFPDGGPGSSYLAYFEERALDFPVSLSGKGPDAAEATLLHLRDGFRDSDSLIVKLRLKFMEATLDYYRGRHAQALALSREVHDGFAGLGMRPDQFQCRRLSGWCATRLGQWAEREASAEAAAGLLAGMADSLPEEEKAVYLLNKWTTEEEELGVRFQRLAALEELAERSPWYARPFRKLTVMREQDHMLDILARLHAERRIAGTGRVAETSEEIRPKGMWRRLLGHPVREWTLAFVALPDRLILIRMGFLVCDFRVIPCSRATLRERVGDLQEAISRIGGLRPGAPARLVAKSERAFEAASSRVVEAIGLAGILARIPSRVRRLRFVPDDVLHGYPFASIRVDGKFLIERAAIRMGSSLATRRRPRRRGTRGGKALVAGVSLPLGGRGALLGVCAELEQVNRAMTGQGFSVTLLEDDRASRRDILERLPGCRRAHISCHGIFKPGDLQGTGLVLPGKEGEEILNIPDLAALELRGMELMVLSSCWSADNYVLPGRRVLSLAQIVRGAGAEVVVASLWSAEEETMLGILMGFYSAQRKLRPSDALRAIQLDCLEGRLGHDRADSFRSAFFWSGVAVYCDG